MNEPLVEALRRPEVYPWHPAAVELVETHISWVFLAGDRVVKVKRPVDFGFVDYTTLERRRHSCEEEVRLNRRLTTDVYLGVVPITRDSQGLCVDGDGQPVEWATLMRRLPAADMLDARLKAGTAPADLGDRLADRLIPFHREALGVPGSPEAFARLVTDVARDNLAELERFSVAPKEFGLVSEAMRRFMRDQSLAFRRRAAAGWVRDGHGDLRCEHVCLEPGALPQVFDCVEFSDELRYVDIASDLAFLLMDLDRLGAGNAAATLLARYRAAGFDLPDDMLRFWWAHRALVRAKVWCLRDPEGLAFAERAVAYIHRAAREVLSTSPALLCMTGLSGTGKSIIARSIADALGIPVLASDRIRKELAGIAGSAPATWGEGIYGPQWTAATYGAMFGDAADILASGSPVLLDATFLEDKRRADAASIAAARGVPFVLVEAICDDAEVRRRLLERAASGSDPSDAGIAIYVRQRQEVAQSPPSVPEGAVHIVIDTTNPKSAPIESLLGELVRRQIVTPRIPDRALLLHD